MNEDTIIHVARDGENIGAWPMLQIRQMVAAGQILLTDHYYDEDEQKWLLFLPQPRRSTLPFDWSGADDHLWFYIKDGFIHGPRQAEEIDALYKAGFITGPTSLCILGAEEWFTYDELLDSQGVKAAAGQDHLDTAKNMLLQGNILGAALNFGAFFVTNETPSDPVIKAKSVHPAPRQLK